MFSLWITYGPIFYHETLTCLSAPGVTELLKLSLGSLQKLPAYSPSSELVLGYMAG